MTVAVFVAGFLLMTLGSMLTIFAAAALWPRVLASGGVLLLLGWLLAVLAVFVLPAP